MRRRSHAPPVLECFIPIVISIDHLSISGEHLKIDKTMKIMAFNGSPRKKWNTATLLAKALEGAASRAAETELIHLYDLDYKACISCFACKDLPPFDVPMIIGRRSISESH